MYVGLIEKEPRVSVHLARMATADLALSDSLERDRSLVERPQPEARVGSHLLEQLIVLQQVRSLSRAKTGDDVLASKVDAVVEVTLEEAKFVVEDHRAVSPAGVGELIVLDDGEAGLFVEDTRQVLRVDREQKTAMSRALTCRGVDRRDSNAQRFERSFGADQRRDGR